MPRRQVAAATVAARMAARQQVGRLSASLVKPRTLKKYTEACTAFDCWLALHGVARSSDLEELDGQVCEWIEHLWAQGLDKNYAGFTLSGLQFALRRKRILQSGWRLLKAWQHVELPARAAPMPAEVLHAAVFTAITWDRLDLALLMMVAFSGFLRSMEFMSLQPWQIQLDGLTHSVVVTLPLTKSGQRKGV